MVLKIEMKQMKKIIFLIYFLTVILVNLTAQKNEKSAFVKDFSITQYEEKNFKEADKIARKLYEESKITGEAFKTRCHLRSQFDWSKGGTQISCYSDAGLFAGDLAKGLSIPKNLPPFVSLIIYYHYEAPFYSPFPYVDGWEIVEDVRFTGHKYIATDSLRIRDKPSLSGTQIGRLVKGEAATVIAVGEKTTIDGIESAWVQIKTNDGTCGWCFAGYLTDGTEYKK